MKSVLVTVFALLAAPAVAQSSLGISGAEVSLGVVEDENGASRSEARAVVDVAVTDVHGFQGDLSFADTASGGVGGLAAHLYMAPREGQKYGLFATLSDVDGRSLTYATLGAEGMLAIGYETTLEGQAGIGAASDGGMDFIFAGAALHHEVSPALHVSAALDLAEIDETALRGITYDAALKASYSPEGKPWGVFASVNHSGISGRDEAAGKTRLGAGFTLSLGKSGGVKAHSRPFRTIDPLAPLLRRDLW